MKYGWIAFVTMMVTLLSTGQVAAQYGPEEIGPEESPISDPDTETEAPMSERDKLKALEAESETPTVTGARPGSSTSSAAISRLMNDRRSLMRSCSRDSTCSASSSSARARLSSRSPESVWTVIRPVSAFSWTWIWTGGRLARTPRGVLLCVLL